VTSWLPLGTRRGSDPGTMWWPSRGSPRTTVACQQSRAGARVACKGSGRAPLRLNAARPPEPRTSAATVAIALVLRGLEWHRTWPATFRGDETRARVTCGRDDRHGGLGRADTDPGAGARGDLPGACALTVCGAGWSLPSRRSGRRLPPLPAVVRRSARRRACACRCCARRAHAAGASGLRGARRATEGRARRRAKRSRCRGIGPGMAKSQVNPYTGSDSSSRACCHAAMASS
jgi:hypothetical protein